MPIVIVVVVVVIVVVVMVAVVVVMCLTITMTIMLTAGARTRIPQTRLPAVPTQGAPECTGFRIHCPMAFSPCCVPVQSINDDTKAAAYPVGKNKDSTDEAAVETVQDDTTAVAYLVGKSKDSTDEASAESMKNDTTAFDITSVARTRTQRMRLP